MSIKPSLFKTGGGEELAVRDAYAPVVSDEDKAVLRTESIRQASKGLQSVLKKHDPVVGGAAAKMIDKNTPEHERVDDLSKSYGLGGDDEDLLFDVIFGEDDPHGSPATTNKKKAKLLKFIHTNGIESTIDVVKGTKVKNSSDLVNLINNLKGEPIVELLDLESKFALIEVAMEKARELGVVGILDDLLETIEDHRDIKRWLSDNLLSFFHNGDVENINLAMDWMTPKGVMARVPDGPTRLLRYYRKGVFGSGVKDPGKVLRKKWSELKDCLYRLDPNWKTIVWNGERIHNHEPFATASRDAMLVSEHDHEYHRYFILAKEFRQMPIQNWARRSYRYLMLNVESV